MKPQTLRIVFSCPEWIPLASRKKDELTLECKSNERFRLAVIIGMSSLCDSDLISCISCIYL